MAVQVKVYQGLFSQVFSVVKDSERWEFSQWFNCSILLHCCHIIEFIANFSTVLSALFSLLYPSMSVSKIQTEFPFSIIFPAVSYFWFIFWWNGRKSVWKKTVSGCLTMERSCDVESESYRLTVSDTSNKTALHNLVSHLLEIPTARAANVCSNVWLTLCNQSFFKWAARTAKTHYTTVKMVWCKNYYNHYHYYSPSCL